MGLFWRILAPKPLKAAGRAAHPVSLVTPRPVRRAKRAAAKAVNPIGALGDAVENQIVRASRGPNTRGGSRPGGGERRLADSGSAWSTDEPVEEDAHAAGPALRTAKQGEELVLRTSAGSRVAVAVDGLIDPAEPLAPGARVEGSGDEIALVLNASLGLGADHDPDARFTRWLDALKQLARVGLLVVERHGQEVRVQFGPRALRALGREFT